MTLVQRIITIAVNNYECPNYLPLVCKMHMG